MNSRHDSINFTIEQEDNNTLPFLDCKVTGIDNALLQYFEKTVLEEYIPTSIVFYHLTIRTISCLHLYIAASHFALAFQIFI